jgi:hypothetical protein
VITAVDTSTHRDDAGDKVEEGGDDVDGGEDPVVSAVDADSGVVPWLDDTPEQRGGVRSNSPAIRHNSSWS